MAYNIIFKYECIPVVYSVSIANIYGKCNRIKKEGCTFCDRYCEIGFNLISVNFLENKNHLSTNLVLRE